MAHPGDTGDDDDQSTETDGEGVADWFAASALRMGLAVLGIVLLLFALGQAVGFPLLEIVADAFQSRIGRWLAVAFFALLLIVVALRGFGVPAED